MAACAALRWAAPRAAQPQHAAHHRQTGTCAQRSPAASPRASQRRAAHCHAGRRPIYSPGRRACSLQGAAPRPPQAWAQLRQHWQLTVPAHTPRAAHRSSWRSIWLCMQRADAMLSALSRNWLSTWNTTCGRPQAPPRQRAAHAPAARAGRRPTQAPQRHRQEGRRACAAAPLRSDAAPGDRGRWEGLAAPWLLTTGGAVHKHGCPSVQNYRSSTGAGARARLYARDAGVDGQVPDGRVRRAARDVDGVGPGGQPHGRAHAPGLHAHEQRHEQREAERAAHGADVHVQHVRRDAACGPRAARARRGCGNITLLLRYNRVLSFAQRKVWTCAVACGSLRCWERAAEMDGRERTGMSTPPCARHLTRTFQRGQRGRRARAGRARAAALLLGERAAGGRVAGLGFGRRRLALLRGRLGRRGRRARGRRRARLRVGLALRVAVLAVLALLQVAAYRLSVRFSAGGCLASGRSRPPRAPRAIRALQQPNSRCTSRRQCARGCALRAPCRSGALAQACAARRSLTGVPVMGTARALLHPTRPRMAQALQWPLLSSRSQAQHAACVTEQNIFQQQHPTLFHAWLASRAEALNSPTYGGTTPPCSSPARRSRPSTPCALPRQA